MYRVISHYPNFTKIAEENFTSTKKQLWPAMSELCNGTKKTRCTHVVGNIETVVGNLITTLDNFTSEANNYILVVHNFTSNYDTIEGNFATTVDNFGTDKSDLASSQQQ
jgi:hypothetical protein